MKYFNKNQFVDYNNGTITAEDKAKFANKLAKFVENGFKESEFSKSFYNRLSLCFGHFAHYDKYGFWCTWFSDPTMRWQWINYILEQDQYGDPKFTFSDVEKVFIAWLKNNETIIDKIMKQWIEHENNCAMRIAQELTQKY